ncbi:MAG: hypothetical protein JNK24_00900 [Alphaproteobacteria bacterium]|nr:hypothetical protein [Alphaproteobacteria bacterium]
MHDGSGLSSIWTGKVFGTNTGNLFIEFKESGSGLEGILKFMDNLLGLVIYKISGSFDDKLKIMGEPLSAPENLQVGDLEIDGALNSQGHIQGTWKTVLGTQGTFIAFPHEMAPAKSSSSAGSLIPEQIYIKSISLGAITLFSDDIVNLISVIKQDFVSGRVIVTYTFNGNEVTRYEEAFLANAEKLGALNYLKISIQEHEAHGINRVVVIELQAFGQNEIRVQGIHESWVLGKAEIIAGILKRHQNGLITKYKKFGLNLNQLVFLAMLVAMPSITPWWYRAGFALCVFLLLSAMLWLHAKYIPNALIKMSASKPTWFSRIWPSLISWLTGIVGAVIGGYILYLITR